MRLVPDLLTRDWERGYVPYLLPLLQRYGPSGPLTDLVHPFLLSLRGGGTEEVQNCLKGEGWRGGGVDGCRGEDVTGWRGGMAEG